MIGNMKTLRGKSKSLIGVILALLLMVGLIPINCLSAVKAHAAGKQAYAALLDDGSINFYKRENIPSVGDVIDGKTVYEVYQDIETKFYDDWGGDGWPEWTGGASFYTIVDEDITPVSTVCWFVGARKINGLEKLNTSKVVNMTHMFRGAFQYDYYDESKDEYVFTTSLDLSSFNTSSVRYMESMFQDCYYLESIDLSSFDTTQVLSTKSMFEGCSSLTSLDLSSFYPLKLTNTEGMFSGCEVLSNIYISNLWTGFGPFCSENMFYNCINLPNYDDGAIDWRCGKDNGYVTYKAYIPKNTSTVLIDSTVSLPMHSTYSVYKIFNGDVSADGKMSNITWSNDGMEYIVMNELVKQGLSSTANAQQAAEFLREKLGDTNKKTILAKDSIGMKIADFFRSNAIPPYSSVFVGQQTPLQDGYYLMIGPYGGRDTTISSPIYTVVGGGDLYITEKTSLPTLNLKIKEDSTGLWGKVADHAVTDIVECRMIATLPQNFISFNNYECTFCIDFSHFVVDGWPNDSNYFVSVYLDKDGDGNVTIDDKITSGYEKIVPSLGGTPDAFYKIKLTSLSSIADITEDSKIIVDVNFGNNSAVLIPNNRNVQAKLFYTTDPISPHDRLGKTAQDIVYDYSYNMKITKQDKATSSLLPNTQFTIKTKAGTYLRNNEFGQVFEDSTNPSIWTTDENGVITLNGVDADEYIIEEVAAPNSYTKLSAPFKTTITANYDDILAPVINTSLTDADANLISLTTTPGLAADIIVKNVKNLNLPFTGEQGIMILVVAGLILVIVGVGKQSTKRRKLNVDINSLK